MNDGCSSPVCAVTLEPESPQNDDAVGDSDSKSLQVEILEISTNHGFESPILPTSTTVSVLKPCLGPKVRSIGAFQPAIATPSPRKWHKKTVVAIFGFQLAALLSALCHYILCVTLDGSPVDSTNLNQSQVSATSLLLVTIFKATLTASVGSCFAQHLWLVLRVNATPVSLIEKLFCLRTNLLALADIRAIERAPMLFSMALFVWCIGIATIYPPGSIIVGLHPHTTTDSMEVSVMNPKPPTGLGIEAYLRLPSLANFSPTYFPCPQANVNLTLVYDGPKPYLLNIAPLIVMGSRILNAPTHTGVNSTYRLKFRAPRYKCNTTTSRVTRSFSFLNTPLYNTSYGFFKERWFESGGHHKFQSFTKYNVDHNYTTPSESVPTVEGFVTVENLTCSHFSAMFDVGITHTNGVQSIDHIASDLKPLPYSMHGTKLGGVFIEKPQTVGWNDSLCGYFADPGLYPRYLPVLNEGALFTSLERALEATIDQVCAQNPVPSYECQDSSSSEDGMRVAVCERRCGIYRPTAGIGAPFVGSVFHTNRFVSTPGNKKQVPFDAFTDLNPTEDLLNEVLFNLTISALSLNLWKDKVPVTTTLWRNTYQFSHRMNLILPYGIFLAIAMIFAVVAMCSLHRNGEPAADGGFLQTMMATRGDTEMERLVLTQGTRAADEISKELGQLRVRYAELVGQEGRMGFGTIEETLRSGGELRQRRSAA